LESLTSTPLPATIHSFDIYPPQVAAGDPITLSWSAIGERTLINKLDYKGRLLEPAYTVPLSGTLVITDYHQQGSRVGFMFSACSGGLCDNATISAEVICAHEWFFSFPPPDCPAAPGHTVVVAQHFERGLMLWLEATGWRVHDEIVILYDDDPAVRPRWEMIVDEWVPGMLEEDPEIIPPSGYLEPIRGFGKIWRESTGVRERLGWATDNEFVVENGAFQCALASYGRCYVTGPGDVVYVLKPERSGWGIEPEPPSVLNPTPVAPPTPYHTPDTGVKAGAVAPYCRPGEASVELSASARTLQVGQLFTVTLHLVNGDTSGVRLGLIQYTLGVQPPGIFSSSNWGPLESTLTLEPGQSDVARFVLQAETPGSATLDGLASYEMHDVDTFWGSWSGCHSWPLEINVTP
jgi:hypothetical protein